MQALWMAGGQTSSDTWGRLRAQGPPGKGKFNSYSWLWTLASLTGRPWVSLTQLSSRAHPWNMSHASKHRWHLPQSRTPSPALNIQVALVFVSIAAPRPPTLSSRAKLTTHRTNPLPRPRKPDVSPNPHGSPAHVHTCAPHLATHTQAASPPWLWSPRTGTRLGHHSPTVHPRRAEARCRVPGPRQAEKGAVINYAAPGCPPHKRLSSRATPVPNPDAYYRLPPGH